MDTVWARDPNEGFVLAHISEILEDGVEVIPFNPKYPKRLLPFNDIFKAQDDDLDKDFDDNCNTLFFIKLNIQRKITGEMMFLNEGSLLNNIRVRYYKNKIYVKTHLTKTKKF